MYPLERSWSIWEMWNTNDTANYASNMQRVGLFSTMWDFLQHWENLPHSQPSFYFSCHKDGTERRIEGLSSPIESVGIFEEGVMPAWEDPVNSKGSDFSFRKNVDEANIKEIWKKLVFYLVGETMALSEEVVGVRIVDKQKAFKCEIWVRFDAESNPLKSDQIRKWVYDCLGFKIEDSGVCLHKGKSNKKP